MHRKAQSKVLSKIVSSGVLFGLLSAGFIAAPSEPAEAENRPSITSCTITDGVTSQSVWPLSIPLDAISIPGARVRMVPTPSSGHIVYATVGFAKKDGSQWAHLGGGIGLATVEGYQPPGYQFVGDTRDAGSVTVAEYLAYTQYPRSEWNYEYRYYAFQANLQEQGALIDFNAVPLCKITIGATDPVVTGRYAVTIPGGSTAVENYTASRPVTSWSVTDYFGGAPLFEIPSGMLSFRAPSNPFPFGGTDPIVYQAPITATDNVGNQFGGTVFISFLIASQIPPVISGSSSVTTTAPSPSVGNYTADETVTWSVTGGADQNLFQINPSGTLSFVNAPTARTYTVIITATDTDNNTTTKTITVTVGAAAPQNSSTSSGSSPQKQHVSTLNTTPAPGETVAMFGSYFEGVTEVFVGGVKVEIVSKADNRVNIRMPRGLTGALDVELKSPLGSLLLPKHFTIGKLPAAGGQKATIVVGGFDPNSRILTARMKARIDRWLNRNSDLSTLTCTGFTSLPKRTTDVELSTNRGATACSYAKGQRPDVTTSVSQGIEDPRPGSNVRRVRLVLTP